MRHIFTLSLVFFSLTHLARAERVEGLRILSRQYCDKQQTSASATSLGQSQPDDPFYPFFLSYSDLTTGGSLARPCVQLFSFENQSVVSLAVKETPKNNSP
ncbi:MAG: hypothetical protein EOO92_11125 [Pedobacter sp.]|nr:MAG: hypothetical protein EOO92_11125 [Pedobacter sp.]